MENQIVKYVADQMEIQLSPEMVKKCLVSGDKNEVTEEEITLFMNLCCYRHLNPFLKEAYLVKFKGSPAQVITSQDVFIKRADRNEHYKGREEGVIVQMGDITEKRIGMMVYPSEVLLGGWCKVYRDDRDYSEVVEVLLQEYDRHMALWKDKPATMIVKVARSQALRKAFPDELAGLYDEAEGVPIKTINITPAKEPVTMPRSKSEVQKAESQATDLNEAEPTNEQAGAVCVTCGASMSEKSLKFCEDKGMLPTCYKCQQAAKAK